MTATVHAQSVRPLAQDHVVVCRSEHPADLYLGSPSITVLPSGRLVASLDQYGPGVEQHCTGPIGNRYHYEMRFQGLIYTSDDGGRTWTQRAKFPFCHARLFCAGQRLYLLGHCGNIQIMVSDDGGTTWGAPVALTDADDRGGRYTQAPANVLTTDGHVHLLMMYITDFDYRGYFISTLALAGLRAPVDADLCDRASWTISAPSRPFRDLAPDDQLDHFGIPFFRVPDRDSGVALVPGRPANRIGWHEAHLAQITDPTHMWHDPTGRTFHVLARADAHRANMAALAVMRLDGNGQMRFELQKTPAGKCMTFLPMPGGNIKFHVLYDKPSGLHWLVSNQITDSMVRPDAMPADRFGLPLDQRRRLALHYSKNLVDWTFAGMVAIGEVEQASRHYASMVIDGEDLRILSRSGDAHAKNPHDVNLITFHTVKDFRGLVY